MMRWLHYGSTSIRRLFYNRSIVIKVTWRNTSVPAADTPAVDTLTYLFTIYLFIYLFI